MYLFRLIGTGLLPKKAIEPGRPVIRIIQDMDPSPSSRQVSGKVFPASGILVLFLLVCSFYLEAQVQPALSKQGFRLIRSDGEGLLLENTIDQVPFRSVSRDGLRFTRIAMPGYTGNDEPGQPELPGIHTTIQVPEGARVSILIRALDSIVISLADEGYPDPLFPVQPGVTKQERDVWLPLVMDTATYRDNHFVGRAPVIFESLGTMRGSRLGRISVSPFRYNPVKNLLISYQHILFEVRFIHPDPEQTRQIRNKYFSPYFEQSLKKSLNYEPPAGKSGLPSGEISYVILADPQFRDALQAFIAWKKKKGFRVIERYTGTPETGSTPEEYQAALSELYHHPPEGIAPPTFLLIVGDVAQIPSSKPSGNVTDLYYACYDGDGDYLPEVYYGRFSANNPEELNPQLEKTLEYEQYQFPDPSFLDEAVMIAGADAIYAPVHGNGQINYGTRYYINPAHGITSHTYLYPESSTSAQAIKNNISQGVGFVNYTGHGQYDRWENPRFQISDIDGLQNAHRYPLMIGNGCETNSFGNYACLGEALLRADQKGALGYIGGSNDSYWDEDYYWAVGVGEILSDPLYEETGPGMYDKTFHDGGEPVDTWSPSQGQMIFAGNMAVQEGNIQMAKYYWEIYHLLGDPSLMPFFSVPAENQAEFFKQVPAGTSGITIQTTSYSYAGLSSGDSLLASGMAGSDGILSLSFPPVDKPDTLELVITGQNRKPLTDTLFIVDPGAAFLSLASWSLQDSTGNKDGLPNPGEELFLAFVLENLGLEDAGPIDIRLSSPDTLITLIDSLANLPALDGQSIAVLDTALRFRVGDLVPDGYHIRLQLRASCNGQDFDHYLYIGLAAPVPVLSGIQINDSLSGNLNRRIDPGERFSLTIKAGNQGSGALPTPILSLQVPKGLTILGPDSVLLDSIAAGGESTTAFLLECSDTVRAGTLFPLTIQLGSGMYQAESQVVRPAGVIYEDFETGDLDQFPWVNDPDHPWELSSTDPAEGSWALVSGKIDDGQTSRISLSLYFPLKDTLFFRRKVSSERKYDLLRLYLDGKMQLEWSGELDWEEQFLVIPEGMHTLMFLYQKDYNTTTGSDRAWIDLLRFPECVYRPIPPPVADPTTGNLNGYIEAGEDLSVFLSLDNPGITSGIRTTARLSCQNDRVRVQDSIYEFQQVITPAVAQLDSRFGLTIDPLVTDQEEIPLVVTLTDSSRGSWQYYSLMTVQAPRLEVTRFWWNDSLTGNANGQLDP